MVETAPIIKRVITSDQLELTQIVRPTCLFAFLAPIPHEGCTVVCGSGARCDSVPINWVRQLPNDIMTMDDASWGQNADM